MKGRVAVGLLIVLVAVLIPEVAAAKGTREAKVTGPGLASPIRLPAGSITANDLARAAGLFAGQWAGTSTDVERERPPGDLGPRYVAKYRWLIGPNETVPVRQELYPFAAIGPVTFTPSGQRVRDLISTGGWYRAGHELIELLVSRGMPPNAGSVVAAQNSWTRRTGAHGVSIAYPSTWNASSAPLTALIEPAEALAVGTYALRPSGSSCPIRALEDLGPRDALITVYVWAARQAPDLPTAPDRFGPHLDWDTRSLCSGSAVHGTLRALSFEDNGRQLFVYLLLGRNASARRRAEAYQMLGSLVVEPAGVG